MKYLKGWVSYNESNNNEFDYMMLGRLQNDVEYYLGHGGRSERNLYYGNVAEHIQAMKDLWNKLEEKPEWLTMEQILDYEKQMLGSDMGSESDMDMGSDMDDTEFMDWWMNGGQDIADTIYGEEAKQNVQAELDALGSFDSEANMADDNNTEIEYNNIISNEIERLARENNLHLK
jgi:hypothetical protein